MIAVQAVCFVREQLAEPELGVAVLMGEEVDEDTQFIDQNGEIVPAPVYHFNLVPHFGSFRLPSWREWITYQEEQNGGD